MGTNETLEVQGAQGQRRALLKALLIITGVSGALFFVINTQRGLHLLATIELVTGAASMMLYVVVSRTRNLRVWTLVYLIPFLTIMMVAMYLPGTSPTVFLWVYIIPVISHLLLGLRLGFAVAVFFMLTAFAIFVLKHPRLLYEFHFASLANILISCAVALAFAYVYERGSEKARAGLMVIASTDPLTRLANLYRFRESFQQERHRAQRYDADLTLLVLDLDYFKKVNDTHGHAVGDQVLIHVANILRRRLRASDLVCRVGGEEFTVLLPDTGLEEAIKVAASLRRLIRDTPYRDQAVTVSLSCSIGVALWQRDGETLEQLMEAGDKRLYQAKQAGRDRVESGPVAG